MGGGIGGEIAGTAIGTAIAGPVGGAVGFVVGAIAVSAAASWTAHALSDKLTQWFFGLTHSEALDNAYDFIGVKKTASNSEINTAYHKKALRYHPDKVGDSQKVNWTKLLYSMAVIKAEREEY